MSANSDIRLDEAKAIPVRDVVDRVGVVGLRQMSGELIGPCPLCGGRDRFGVNLRSHKFQCRKCDVRGGDGIALVMQVLGYDFKAALTFLCGDAPAVIDPEEIARREAKAEQTKRQQEQAQARYRQNAIRDALSIWQRSRPGAQGVVRSYLTARGFAPDLLRHLPNDLRFIWDHPYVKKIDGALVTAHRGPCMIAAIRQPNGDISAVHQTWVDTSPPHGKARIQHEGAALPSKMVRGSKKGGAIRLYTPKRFRTLVIGEGIETTLTALVGWGDVLGLDQTAFWAGVDLGNMSGRMTKLEGTRFSGVPDMTDTDAFRPPPWITREIYVQDGDSHAKATRAKLECGLRRAMATVPGLRAQIVHAGDGVDLNDVLTAGAQDD
ncbi:hypothetical protein [uncultured Tateyamaria sp.]|uniref:DUF7146 domain-containing protein n=1 Tax=Tateyamaria sp. 1078 TaxID=3417464 RepID=UPI00263867DC|nr:hypothetical protein [uncultured Tateyamaria sp.]